MEIRTLFIGVFFLVWGSPLSAQKVFKVEQPDFAKSPYTGMTRQHWLNAAHYLLEGAFTHVSVINDPMVFPKQPGVSYPRNGVHTPTEMLEGLCRTLFVAVPLLKEDSNLTIKNIRVADYYRLHISKLLDSSSVTFIRPRAKKGGPSQTLVEFGALAVSLFAIPELLWEPLPKAQKDALSKVMISYGDGPTVPSNWKFFNIFVLSFFKDKGYSVNEKLLTEYLDKTLEHYRGNGWYNDNPAYDYYSMWAFQMYAPLWSEFFGKKYYPAYAEKFAANFSEVKNNYPYLFSRNGEMIMWGRSMAYRFGAIVPFPLMGMKDDPGVNYGWMRRIASGTLLQFLQNPSFLEDEVPTLGFYGAFEPTVQSYSCRGSVYWMGKAFLGLLIPKNSRFWTETENEGAWAGEMKKGQVYNKFQDSSNILITDYPNIGASEIRAWCHVEYEKSWEKFRASENYNRLSYNSAFPWQADSVNGVVAMNYIFRNAKAEWEPLRLFTFKKFEDGVYYRDVVLESNRQVQLNLAEMPLPNGILRVDRYASTVPVEMRLGHYALPQIKGAVKEKRTKADGYEVHIIDNGVHQLAMVTLSGWQQMQTNATTGVHPVSKESKVINAHARTGKASANQLFVTLMLWKKSGKKWRKNELFPVKVMAKENGAAAELHFRDGTVRTIRF